MGDDHRRRRSELKRGRRKRGAGPFPHPRHRKILLGIEPRPEPQRIEVAILLLTLVSLCGDSERVALLGALTWLNWAPGHASKAERHPDELRAIDAQYWLVRLLQTVLGIGRLPEWAFEDAGLRLHRTVSRSGI